jgi:hypothetical protein
MQIIRFLITFIPYYITIVSPFLKLAKGNNEIRGNPLAIHFFVHAKFSPIFSDKNDFVHIFLVNIEF